MTAALFVLNGLERSGTIWTTRLLADSLGIAAHSRQNDPPFTTEDDPAVWHLERSGKYMRRLHCFVQAYPYDNVPCVIIQRDPRDVAVSQVEATRIEEPYDVYAERLLPNWCHFHEEWWTDPRRVGHVRYEDLLTNPHKEISRVIGLLGLPINLEAIDRAVQEHKFSAMNNKHKGRHGKAGTWREALSPGGAARLWELYGHVLLRFGYGSKGVL